MADNRKDADPLSDYTATPPRHANRHTSQERVGSPERFTYNTNGGLGERTNMFLAAGFQSGSRLIPSPTRHRYGIDPSAASVSSQFTSPPIANMEDCRDIESQARSPFFTAHRNTIASEGFESVLREIDARCKNSDSIIQDLDCKLQLKNQQLSQNLALLEHSKTTISRLQCESDNHKKEKCAMNAKLQELIAQQEEVDQAQMNMESAMACLRQQNQSFNQQVNESNLIIAKLDRELGELNATNTNLKEEAHISALNLEGELQVATETMSDLQTELAEKDELINRQREVCKKEEERRHHSEREAQLVTEQGQSLMEQQAAIRSQYQEDLEAHQSRIETLQALILEKEKQYKKLQVHLMSQEQSNQKSINTLHDELAKLNETHESQSMKDQTEISSIREQLVAKTSNGSQLQQTITALKEQSNDTEQRLLQKHEQQNIDIENLKYKLEEIKSQHAKEIEAWKQRCYENANQERICIESKMSEFESLRKGHQRDKIALECRLAELEDMLDDRENAVTSLKDAIQELAENENKSLSNYNNVLVELTQSREQIQKFIEEKDVEMSDWKEKLSKQNIDFSVHSQHNTNTIVNLKSTVASLTNENSELRQKLEQQTDEHTSLQNAYEKTKESAERLSSTKALLSRKESSKAILFAEQQRMEHECAMALSERASAVNNLEREIKSLQQQNADLRTRSDSLGTANMRSSTAGRNHMTATSFGSIPRSLDTEVDSSAKILLAKQQSSNQILIAENMKMKSELKNTNAFWNRDVNEMQRRNMVQSTRIHQLEEKVNIVSGNEGGGPIKRQSINADTATMTGTADDDGEDAHYLSYENLLDHYTHELSIKEYKIQKLEDTLQSAQGETNAVLSKLETASEQEQIMKIGLETKLSKNEIDACKIQHSLTEIELCLEKLDHMSARNLLRQSNKELLSLVQNIKQANRSASDTLKSAADKRSSLISLHDQFSKTLSQIQQDAESANIRQQNEVEVIHKEHEEERKHMQKVLQQILSETKSKSQQLASIIEKKTELETAVHKFEESLRNAQIDASTAHRDLEVTIAAKVAKENHVNQLEETIDQLRTDQSELESKYRLAETDINMLKERELAQLRSQYEMQIAKDRQFHNKELQQLSERLRCDEKENIKLLTEVNQLQDKVHNASTPLQGEIHDLHSQVQRLTMEKSELQERFREGLTTLKTDHDLILQERTNQIHRLHCQISELEEANRILRVDCENYKTVVDTQCEQFKQFKIESMEQINIITTQFEASQRKTSQLIETIDLKKTELIRALEELTKSEIDCVRLKNQSNLEAHEHNGLVVQYKSSFEKMKLGLDDGLSRNKDLETSNRELKLTLKTLLADHQLEKEKLAMSAQDLRHAESLNQLYRERFDTAKTESGLKLTLEKLSLPRTSTAVLRKDEHAEYYHTIHTAESEDGLGANTAALTNQVVELQKASCLLTEQMETRLQHMLDKNEKLNKAFQCITKEKIVCQESLEKLKVQLQHAQSELKQCKVDYKSLELQYDNKTSELTHMKIHLEHTEMEAESLQRKLNQLEVLKDLASTRAVSEAELTRRNDELNTKLHCEREKSFKIEKGIGEQAIHTQKEFTVMKQQLEDAFQANRGLENHIQKLKTSFNQVLPDDEPDRPNLRPNNESSRRKSSYYDAT